MTREEALSLKIGDIVFDMKNPGYPQGTEWVVHGEWKGGFPILIRSGKGGSKSKKQRMLEPWNLHRYQVGVKVEG